MKAILDILENDLRKAIAFLKKKYPRQSRDEQPWYLVIGASGVGKTSLLINNAITFENIQGEPVKHIYPTQHCQWLFSDKAVFLDMTGRYTPEIWTAWFKLLQRYTRNYYPVQGILLVFDLKHSRATDRQIEILLEWLGAISDNIQQTPVSIVFTQCDHIAGFTEFFEDLSVEQKKEGLGFRFSSVSMQEDFLKQFDEQYDALIKRLNESVLLRLHQARNVNVRMLIKHFPLQLSVLKKPARALLLNLIQNFKLNLKGIYFTSSRQEGRAINYLTQNKPQALPLLASQGHSENVPHTALFVKAMLDDLKLEKMSLKKWRDFPLKLRYAVYILSGFMLLGGGSIAYVSNRHNMQLIKDTETLLADVDLNENSHLLSSLDQLGHAMTVMKKRFKEEGKQFIPYSKPVTELYQLMDSAYAHLLNARYLNQIKSTVEEEIINQKATDSEIYSALHVYLMLGDLSKRDDAFVRNWFRYYWQQQNLDFSRGDQAKRLQYLEELLANQKTIDLNKHLVKQARERLLKLSPSQLVFVKLKTYYVDDKDTLLPGDLNFLTLGEAKVPAIFQRKNVKSIYQEVLPYLCRALAKGDPVLKTPTQPVALDDLERMISQVQLTYLKNYAAFWKAGLKLETQSFNSLEKIQSLIRVLKRLDLHAMVDNTAPIPGFKAFNRMVSEPFAPINQTIAHWKNSPLEDALNNLNTYFSLILESDKGAFVAAKMRMEDNAQKDPITELETVASTMPDPFNAWFTQLAKMSWSQVLDAAHQYIAKQWTSQIWPFYQAHIEKQYPVFKGASVNMKLETLTQFFSDEGLFTQFYRDYLSPFVTQYRYHWQWKKIDGLALSDSQSVLETLIRADLIKKMFFSKNEKTPSFEFSFKAVKVGEGVEDFIFQFDEQFLNKKSGGYHKNPFTWPGKPPYQVSMKLMGENGDIRDQTEQGVWALFKLLDKNHVENSLDSKRLDVIFKMGEQTLAGEFWVKGEINPLIQGVLASFRCPQSI